MAFIFLDSNHLRYVLDQLYQGAYWVDMAERLIYPLLVITALLFQRSLLRIWENNIKLDNLVKGFFGAFLLVLAVAFAPNEKIFQYLYIFLITLAIPLAFYTNIDAIRRGNVTAVVHMAAIGVFLSGVIILMLLQLWPGFPSNTFTENAYNMGLVAQALLLSISLSYRYNQIKQEKEDAQLLAINNLVRSEQIKDDLLDFSAAKEEATYVKFRPVDLNSLVTLVIAVCRPLIGEKNLELRSEVDPDLPLVAGDEDRLQQILVNLTSNAIKFTYSGEVVISAELTTDYNVTVSLRDTGIGIHKTDHDTIFKTFEKLPSQQMNASGIGLGLPLAKRMVEMHRSKLKLESELDVGSTFSFDLRVSLDQTRAIKSPNIHKQMIRRADYLEQANKVADVPKLRSEQEVTILVVDDDEINRVVMGQQLEE